jgi:fatty acid-binding protein DegV
MLYEEAKYLLPKTLTPLMVDITPVLGAHVGPGVFGFVAVKQN